jgi:DNA repair photolyase
MERLLGGGDRPYPVARRALQPLNILTICEHVFVRWDNLIEEEQRHLPGYRDPAVVRTFDAPEALGTRFYEVRAKSALNRVPKQSRMPFRWTINPYRGCAHGCAYCFARPTHTYLDLNAREDFVREIVVKVNVPEVLRAELARPSWKHEHIAMGTNTDPYQWVEGRYRLMEGIWEALRDAGNPASILTKSPLVLRDIKLLQELGERAEVSAAFSVPTIDEKAWRATEPHTPHPRKRLEAVAELNRAGIPTGVLVAPLMPGVNDDPAQVEEIVELATAAGATHIGGIVLHLRGEVRDIWFDWLRAHRPDLVPRHEELYRRGAYAPTAERERLGELVAVTHERARRRHPEAPHPAPPRFRRGFTDRAAAESGPARKDEPQQRALF